MEEEQVVSTEEVAQEEVVAEQTEEKTEETPQVPEETPPPPKKKTAQDRIDELTRLRRQEEREKEYWKKVALEKEKAEKPPEPKPVIHDRPRLDQFETTEQYEDALFEWRDKKVNEVTQAKRQQEEQESALRTFNERAEKIRLEHDDFDEVAERPVFSPAMRDALALDDNGPELVYYLGTHEAEAAKIRNLPVLQQLVQLGELKTKLVLAKQTKKVTSAPPPIKPVGMTGAGTEPDPSNMSTAEWIKWDRERELEKLKKKLGG
jgi:hypothetical protein